MDAGTLEALIGRKLGTSVLQRVIGTGTMGAVYLAYQSPPSRQVAVKVFLRATSLELLQHLEFLETFHKEMTLVYSLQHPSIVPIFDYGDYDGLPYLVMPSIAGESLEDLLAREGALPLPLAASYLQDIAFALDYTHARGIVHRDLKPSNILITPEKKVLLLDFHLTSLLIEGKTAQMRLSKAGLLDYMSPELVVGKQVDGRADLYSLGAILYRMVTGVPPFQGQTLMKVAMKQLKMPPPSPSALRPDLPAAAEQAILKALAKKPQERFETAQDLHLLFRQSITGDATPGTTTRENPSQPLSALTADHHDVTIPRISAPHTSFGLLRRTGALTALASEEQGQSQSDITTSDLGPIREERVSSASLTSITSADTYSVGAQREQQRQSQARALETPYDRAAAQTSVKLQPVTPLEHTFAPQESPAKARVTRVLTSPESNQENTGAITGAYKLTGPAKIVTIPIAGQPGQYVTGILPSSPTRPLQSKERPAQAPIKQSHLSRFRVPAFALAALLIVLGSLTFWYVHSSSHHPASSTATGTPNTGATATAAAQATQSANVILFDSLAQNIRNWPVSNSGSILYQFIDGAYHITNNDPSRVAPAILPGEILTQPFVYTLSMVEIHGDDTSVNNEFGIIIGFRSQAQNGKQFVSFYTFEVLNTRGGEYQFWKYDSSQGNSASPWKELAHHPFGSEFHQGQGPKNSNTLKILVNGKNYTLIVNGKQVWTVQDSTLSGGQVGMLVNLKGTEVAFSDLRLTYS